MTKIKLVVNPIDKKQNVINANDHICGLSTLNAFFNCRQQLIKISKK
jgi:hypothetical protein